MRALQERCQANTDPRVEGADLPTLNKNTRSTDISYVFTTQHVSSTTRKLLLSSWRPGTRKQYGVYINKWKSYCTENDITHRTPNLEHV